MYIIVIAWLYVAFMMAITETSAVAGIMTFTFYGLLPVSIVIYLGHSARRRQRRRAEELARRKTREEKEHAPEPDVQ